MNDEASVRGRTGPRLVVGIGASAGGLEALSTFFDHMPTSTGAAFVVVQHLSPDFKSLMVELLARHTEMKVERAEDGCVVQPDHVYLIPPKKLLTIQGGALRLTDRSVTVLGLPIDHFFRSLAEDQGEHAVAIILSGTGTDGVRGLRHVKEAGGFVFVQALASARFDGMPRSAVATGLSDFVLPPEEMPDQLERLLAAGGRPALSVVEGTPPQALEAVLMMLERYSGVSFSEYKRPTVTRRIARRMHVLHTDDIDAYAAHLRENPGEVATLFREMLIGVTKMFRDADAFEALARVVIPAVVGEVRRAESIRVWVPGCSTGEEAYSLAMLFLEAVQASGRATPVRVFATDIDREAIDFAAAGVYPESTLLEVSPERRARFFAPTSEGYQVSRQLRDAVVFAVHNVARDAPFSRLDLVSCRNLLIYLDAPLQQRILALFHYALRDRGFLFLGGSETIGELEGGSFTTLNARSRIYQRVGGAARMNGGHVHLTAALRRPIGRPTRPSEGNAGVDFAARELVDRFAPPSILLTPEGDLVHVFGDASAVLRVPAGAASLSAAAMVPKPLASLLTLASQRALREHAPLALGPVLVETANGNRSITVSVRPIDDPALDRPLVLVSFEGLTMPVDLGLSEAPESHAAGQQLGDLRNELAFTRESLQATIEELETSNEELQSTNEELLSSNEELQSVNEELQSVNEELMTVNTEHQAKIQELVELGTDVENMLACTSVSTLFLDPDLRIRQFTPDVAALVNVLPRDIGRPLDHITFTAPDPSLIDDARSVAGGAPPRERTFVVPDGRTFLRRTLPYHTRDGARRGAVVTYVDISGVVRAEARLQEVIDALPHEIVVLDGQGRITFTNEAWRRAADDGGGAEASMGVGADYLRACADSLARGDSDAGAVLEKLRATLAGRAQAFTHAYACEFRGRMRHYIMHVVPREGREHGVVVTHVEVAVLDNV